MVALGELVARFGSSTAEIADVFTRPLYRAVFPLFVRAKLVVWPPTPFCLMGVINDLMGQYMGNHDIKPF